MRDNKVGLSLFQRINRCIRTMHGEFVLARSIAKQYHNVKKSIPCYSDSEECRIVFIVEKTEVFSSVQSIVEAAVKNSNCSVYLLPVPRCKFAKYDMNSLSDNVSFCKQVKGVTVIDTYDNATEQFFDLKELKPHFIFLSVPYTEEYPEQYRIHNLSKIARICFVPYGYVLENEKLYSTVSTVLNAQMLQNTSFVFSDGPVSHGFCARRLWISEILDGKRLFDLGFPRFDCILGGRSDDRLSKILWIPRWTTDEQSDNTSSSFFKCKDAILDFAKKHPESNIVIRPHPSAFMNYVRCGKMTEDEVTDYKKIIEELPNTTLDNKSSYLPAIDEADIMIADCSSIVIEFFVRNKPIIYTGEQSEMSQHIDFISNTFYYASNWTEIEKIIVGLQNGNDPKKAQREAAVECFMKEHGHAGEKIVQELMKNITIIER